MKTFVRSTVFQILVLTFAFAPVGHAQLVERPLITAQHTIVTSDEPLASMAGIRIPGKRSRSNQSPIIVLKDGKPFMTIGTPGSNGIWQRIVQVIVNIVDFGLEIQSAITAPRMIFGGQAESGTEIEPLFKVEDRIPEAAMNALRAKGYEIVKVKDDGGRVNGILIDPSTGFRLGGADPREDGYAIGW